MTTFPGATRLVQGGLVLLDPRTTAIQRVIVLQYNPDSLTRTLQAQGVGADAGDRLDALRLKAAPVETIKFDAEIDAADQLEFPEVNADTAQHGINPQLAALETVIFPSSAEVQTALGLARTGTLEIAPMEGPLVLFVWSADRIVPVRITEFAITEEAFDPRLHPIRAKVSLGLRVLTPNDLRLGHPGAGIYMAYHQAREELARKVSGSLTRLGVQRIP